ncbi:MAG TPA: CBS domain-containing protein [Azospirillum sp.]|nr:CBS domain-containing protein [Azospirillum sp.]
MKIKDVMTSNPEVARADESVQSVAQRMAAGDFGFVPVCDGRKVIGAVTDRDLAVRALARGLPPTTPVSEVMTRDVFVCSRDDSLDDVLEAMGDKQLRRFPIVTDNGELVGVVSIGDLTTKAREKDTGETLADISKPN